MYRVKTKEKTNIHLQILKELWDSEGYSSWELTKLLSKKGFKINGHEPTDQNIQHHLKLFLDKGLVDKIGSKYVLSQNVREVINFDGTLITSIDGEILFLNCPYYGTCDCKGNLETCRLWKELPPEIKKSLEHK